MMLNLFRKLTYLCFNSTFYFCRRICDNVSTEKLPESVPVTTPKQLAHAFSAETGIYVEHRRVVALMEDILDVYTQPTKGRKRWTGVYLRNSGNPPPTIDDLISSFTVSKCRTGSLNLKHTPYNGVPIVVQDLDTVELTCDDSLLLGDDEFSISVLFYDSPPVQTILRTILISKVCTSREATYCLGLLSKFLEPDRCKACIRKVQKERSRHNTVPNRTGIQG